MGRQLAAAVIFLLTVFPSLSAAQAIVQSRGVDARVDYASLAKYGPWDDRNYALTQEDLELLGENERELDIKAPLFYRIELRKRFSGLPTSGTVQYPRSTLPRFLVEHGGFLIDGQLYRKARLEGDRFVVDTREPFMSEEEYEAKALSGDVRVTFPTGNAESAVAVNPVDPDIVIAGSNAFSGQEMHYSTDGGESWSDAAALPLGDTCCDPTVVWSSDGSKAYAATLGGSSNYIYRSGDGGQTWTDLQNEPGGDPRREVGSGFTDKEYLHGDTHAASACLDDLYLTWHEFNVMKFSRSTDMAHTWSTPVSLSSGGEDGIGSDIGSDSNGHVYYFWPAFGPRKILVRKSTDCGASFASTVEVASTQASYEFPIPSMDSRKVFVYVSAAADLGTGPYGGSVYAAWTDSTAPTGGNPSANHARIQVAYSRDGGATWGTSTPHETADADSVDRWHQWLAVGPDGAVHVIFYDTRNDPTRRSVDVYWSYSTDGAVSWSAPERLTSETSPDISDFFEFGDYNGLDATMNDVIAIFTDNRNESGGGSDSVDVYAAGHGLDTSDIFADGFESGDTTAWSATVD